MTKPHGPRWGVLALLFGAAAGGACGGQASGDYDDGTGAMTGVGPGGMAGFGSGGRGGRGGRGGQGGTAMAGASGRGGSGTGGQGAGGSVSVGGNAGAAGTSMGGGSSMSPGSCSAPTILGFGTSHYNSRIERSDDNTFIACPGNGPEEVIRWTPPQSGRYLIDTFGSVFDTVLYVSSNLACPPTPPVSQGECHDDFISESFRNSQSLLSVQAFGGEDMLIVVDSYTRSGGDFTLNIRGEAECPVLDLDEQLGVAVYSTFEFAADARLLPLAGELGCRGGELGMTMAWQAPLTGEYRFSTSGSGFPAVLALRAGCGGQVIGCDLEGDINNTSELTLSMDQGQEVVIEVTALELAPLPSFGQFVLNIEPL